MNLRFKERYYSIRINNNLFIDYSTVKLHYLSYQAVGELELRSNYINIVKSTCNLRSILTV